MPLISYICFKFSSLSFKIKLTITVGIKERPIPTMNAKSNAFPAFSLCLKTEKTGKGYVVTVKVNVGSFKAVLKTDS